MSYEKILFKQLYSPHDKTIVLVDFANVDHWKDSLTWEIGLSHLAKFVKRISKGKKYLRRFYYGKDYGRSPKQHELLPWSHMVITKANNYGFTIVTKKVKYIKIANGMESFIKKCNFDIEMAVDLIKEQHNYKTAVIFSGDGDLAYVYDYLHSHYNKTLYVFCARGHVGKELIEAKKRGIIKQIFFVENFRKALQYYHK